MDNQIISDSQEIMVTIGKLRDDLRERLVLISDNAADIKVTMDNAAHVKVASVIMPAMLDGKIPQTNPPQEGVSDVQKRPDDAKIQPGVDKMTGVPNPTEKPRELIIAEKLPDKESSPTVPPLVESSEVQQILDSIKPQLEYCVETKTSKPTEQLEEPALVQKTPGSSSAC
jgi:hypothetical protein